MNKLKHCLFCKAKPPTVRMADAIELQCQAEEKEFETLPITYAVVCDINKGGCGATSGFREPKPPLRRGTVEYELYGHTAEEHKGEDEAEADDPEPDEKTAITDCRACWCDRCLNIEVCQKRRDDVLPEGDTPFPCIGYRNGMRFMPEEEPPCEDFVESGTRNNG